jgi:hypothetical protein
MKTKKYVTVTNSNGLGLYEVAKVMTKNGQKMNHSTVRNIINRSFFKLAKNISDSYDLEYDSNKIDDISKSPEFQESIIDLLREKEL